jgi:arylsulfatase A-like enzyme
VLRLAGSELPADRELDGVDLGPLLLGTGSSPRRSLPYYRGGELYAFRRGAWKVHLVTEGAYGRPPERTEHDPAILYHLGEDPGERFDLAALHPEVVAELQAEARAHRDAIEPAPPLFDRRLRALAGTAPAP